MKFLLKRLILKVKKMLTFLFKSFAEATIKLKKLISNTNYNSFFC